MKERKLVFSLNNLVHLDIIAEYSQEEFSKEG